MGHRAVVLERLAVERTRFVERLRGLGGDVARPRHGSWAELGRERARWLRVFMGGPNNGDAVAACRRSCNRTKARFDEALNLPLRGTIREVLVEQRTRLDVSHDALIAVQY